MAASQLQQVFADIINKIPSLNIDKIVSLFTGNNQVPSSEDSDTSAKSPSSETESSEEAQK